MNEIDIDILSKYDIDIKKTYKGRGAIIVNSVKKSYKLVPYNKTLCRLKFVNELLKHIKEKGFENVDIVMENKEGELISTNEFQESYIVKEWYEGEECDVRNNKNVLHGVETLALLHTQMRKCCMDYNGVLPETPSLIYEYDRHIKELKKIRTFMRGRNRKSSFEYDALLHFDEYYDIALRAKEKLDNTKYEELENKCRDSYTFCHGNYNYHNIIFIEDKIAVINFEKAGIGLQIKDLYFYMRKVLEKYSWNIELGYNMLEHYDKICPITEDEHNILMVMLEFPEKFWKVINQYYNGNKSWIPDKNIEKLNTVYTQQQKKEAFISKMSSR